MQPLRAFPACLGITDFLSPLLELSWAHSSCRMSDSSHCGWKGGSSLSICFLPRSCSMEMWGDVGVWLMLRWTVPELSKYPGRAVKLQRKTSLPPLSEKPRPDAWPLPYDLIAPQTKEKKKRKKGLLHSILWLISNCYCWPVAGLNICVGEAAFHPDVIFPPQGHL